MIASPPIIAGTLISLGWTVVGRLAWLKFDGQKSTVSQFRPGSRTALENFFDVETFQHLRSEYERTIYTTDQQRIGGGGEALPSASSQRSSNARISAFEEFSEFRPEGGLNLPHTYKFELSIQSEVRPALVDWTFDLTDFNFSEVLEFK